MQNSAQRPMTLIEKILAMENLMVIMSLSVLVFTRKNIGFRLLNPMHLVGLAVFLLFAGGLTIHTPNNHSLILYAGLILVFGFAQRLRRWIDFKLGRYQHSYYLGDSVWQGRWFPKFLTRNRRFTRTFDPLFCVFIGYTLTKSYCALLGAWIMFCGFALWHVEAMASDRNQHQEMDIIDSLIAADIHARDVEEFSNPTPQPHAQQKAAGIPTGLGDDVEGKIRSHNTNN